MEEEKTMGTTAEESAGKPEKKKRKGLKIFLIILACILGLILIAGGALYLYARHLYSGFTDPDAPEIVDPVSTTEVDINVPEENFSPEKPEEATEEPAEPAPDVTENPEYQGGDYSGDYSGTGSWNSSGYVPPGGWPVETVPIYRRAKINDNVVNILLLGLDVGDLEIEGGGRSDSMIMISYNKSTGSVKMFSFMRDSLVPIEGVGWTKLNHSYAYGKAGLTINTINNAFGLDIQEYAVIDFSGLVEIVDYLGGIDVNLTEAEVAFYGWKDIHPGMNHFGGQRALRHARNRTVGSDYERTRRQRDILMAIYNKVKSEYGIGGISGFVSAASNCVKTNIPFETLVSYATAALSHGVSIEPYQVPLPGTYEGGWYYCPEGWLSVVKINIASNRSQILSMIYG